MGGGTSLLFVTANRIVQLKTFILFSGYFLSIVFLKLLTHIGIDVNGARYAAAESMCERIH